MKIPSLFNKTPKYKQFTFKPRYYDPVEEERRERELRIRKELEATTKADEEILTSSRSRIAGSFKQARRHANRQSSSSTAILRTLILTLLVIWLIAYLQFGKPALYALFILIPIYIYFRFFKK
jgi:Flp pilus assembly protein TadB